MARKTSSAPDDMASFVARLETASTGANDTLNGILHEARMALPDGGWEKLVRAFAQRIDGASSPLLSPFMAWSEDKVEYSVDSFFGKVIVELDLEPEDMVGLIAKAHDQRPSAERWTILSAFERWCLAKPERAKESTKLIMVGDGPVPMLSPALRAGMTHDADWHFAKARLLLEKADDESAAYAGQVLTGDTELPDERVDEVLDAAEARLPRLGGENHSRLFDGTIGLALRTRPARVAALLGLAIEEELGACKQACARHRAIAKTCPDPEAASAVLDFLVDDETVEPMVVDLVDNALRRWLPAEGPPGPFFDALLKLLGRDDVGFDRLDSAAHAILAMEAPRRDAFFGQLMIEGGFGGVDALAQLAHRQIDKQLEPEIDFAPFSLDPDNARVLVRRVAGLFSLAPVTAAAILLSMLRTGPLEVREETESLIFDPILISFWEDGRAFLEARIEKEDEKLKDAIKALIAALDGYISAIRDVGFIDELFPTEANRFLAALKRAADNREINKRATEGSFLADLFPTRLVLNGDSAVFRVFDGDGVGKRAEQEMKSIEHSQPLPRLDAIDPFGYWYRRRLMINGMPV